MIRQQSCRAGFSLCACVDLAYTGQAYSAAEFFGHQMQIHHFTDEFASGGQQIGVKNKPHCIRIRAKSYVTTRADRYSRILVLCSPKTTCPCYGFPVIGVRLVYLSLQSAVWEL